MLKQGFAKTFDNNPEYDILHKKDNSKTKDKASKAKEATSSASSPMPDPDDFEPGKGKDAVKEKLEKNKNYKTNNFEKDDQVGLDRFTVRFEKTKWRDPKTGQYIEKNDAFNSGAGPAWWYCI